MTDIDLGGTVAVVTGAGRGLGRSHALALARAGAAVVVNDLGASLAGAGEDLTPAQEVVDEIEAIGGRALASGENVADFDGARRMIDSALDTFGRLDILVNNAGILRDRMLVNMSEAEWDAVISVHLKGHFAPSHHAARYWRERAKAGEAVRGRIINTSSPSGLFGNVGQVNYGAAKAGIAAFTVIAAQELHRYGVTVNCVAPNARTRMTEETFDLDAAPDGFDPLDPMNVSLVILALCSDAAHAITGQVLHVWGGAVNILRGWSSGELVAREAGWTPGDFLDGLLTRFPNGATPEGMTAGMEAVGGQGLGLT